MSSSPTDTKVALLRRVPLFSPCSGAELESIAMIADELNFRAGTVLVRQGDPGREMFVLIEGTVDVERSGEKVNELGPGDFIGEGALLMRKPRNATITATAPIRALVITDMNFQRLLESDPQMAAKVHETLVGRLPPQGPDEETV